MKKNIFLCSSFTDVRKAFEIFAKDITNNKSVCFIPTASVTEAVNFYVGNAMTAFESMDYTINVLDTDKADLQMIQRAINTNDIIYVSGGNAFYLMQSLRNSGADKLIIEAVENGKAYVGESAGAVIAAPDIGYSKKMDHPEVVPDLQSEDGLGLVDFYVVPHYSNEPFIEVANAIVDEFGTVGDKKLMPLSNKECIAYVDGQIQSYDLV